MRIVCVSDTHGCHGRLAIPHGDLLIHAGDFSAFGRNWIELADFNWWLGKLPHRHKVVVAGNHDLMFEDQPKKARAALTNGVYLQDSEVAVGGLRLYGSPWQPWFLDWAFNLPRGAPLREKWDLIPPGIDILVTHSPPHGILDEVCKGRREGCEELAVAIRRVRPRLHVFGHIHEAYGTGERGGTRFVNASICDAAYRPIRPPVVVDL